MSLLDHDPAAKPSTLASRLSETAMGILPIVVLLLPLTSNTVAESKLVSLTVVVGTMTLFLCLAGLFSAASRRSMPMTPAAATGWILPPVMWLSYLVSPSAPGAILATFALGALGVVLIIAMVGKERLPGKVALPLLITASIQALLVIAQTLTDNAVGLTWIEPGAELHFIDGLLRAQGTMHHVYEPAALALLAGGVALVTADSLPNRWKWFWLGGTGLSGATVGLTHSRSALLGLVLMLPFLAVAARRHRYTRLVGGAFLAGFLIAATFTASAWVLRGEHSVGGDIDDVSLGRVTLTQEAVEMALDHPILGVGPGRYLDVMKSDYDLNPDYPFMVHNVTLAVAAENGIPIAVVASLLVAWAVARAIRDDPLRAALAVSLLGFLVFDVLHYNRPVGLLMTAIWLGVLHATDRHGSITSRRVRSS